MPLAFTELPEKDLLPALTLVLRGIIALIMQSPKKPLISGASLWIPECAADSSLLENLENLFVVLLGLEV